MQKNRHNYKSHWHCVYHLKYHLVLVTKHHYKCFTKNMLNRLEEICREQCSHWDIELFEFTGESNYIHLILNMHPNIMPSRLINSLKTVTSRLLRKEFSDHLKEFYQQPELWTRAYYLVTAEGAPLNLIQKYIGSGNL